MKELNEIARKEIPYPIRLIIASKNRDYTEAAVRGVEDGRFDVSVECFNDSNMMREPDKVGITLSYPAGENKTHFMTKFFSINVGEAEFTRQAQYMRDELIAKIPGA